MKGTKRLVLVLLICVLVVSVAYAGGKSRDEPTDREEKVTVGAVMVGHIQEKISSNIPPKNAKSTIRQKKSSKTLIGKTGLLRESIDFEVVK